MDEVIVLWADMLGFREEIKKLGGSDLKQLVVDWEDLVRTAKCKSGVSNAEVVTLDACSATAPCKHDGLDAMITFARTLLEEGIRKWILVRGAIGVGYMHNDRVIGLAEGLHPVQKLEKESNWIGIACTSEFPIPETLWDWNKLVNYPVPGKEDLARLRPAVAWNVPSVKELPQFIWGRNLKKGDPYTWKMINKAQQTVHFAKYIEAAKEKRLSASDPPRPEYLLNPGSMHEEKLNSGTNEVEEPNPPEG